MADVTIYGASDDLVEIEGEAYGCDEYNTESATFVLTGERGEGVRVSIFYTGPGVWAITASPLDEDVPMLPLTIVGERYTAKATVTGVMQVTREHERV
jgi:hypothetical protein